MTARKSDHLKLLAGTSRYDRAAPTTPVLPVLDVVPNPPAWLVNLEAVREWHRLAGVLTANKLLHAGNLSLFGQMCALHGYLVQAWATGEPPTAALISTHRATCVALGLLGMGLPKAAGTLNKFSTHLRR